MGAHRPGRPHQTPRTFSTSEAIRIERSAMPNDNMNRGSKTERRFTLRVRQDGRRKTEDGQYGPDPYFSSSVFRLPSFGIAETPPRSPARRHPPRRRAAL